MKLKISLLLLLILNCSSLAQNIAKIDIGSAAPNIELNILSQSPEKSVLKIEDFRNKIVVLEFWATWCAPCIPAINHLNQLADEFKDKPIQFVFVTNEDEARITNFIKTTPIKGIVGLDPNNSAHSAYRIIGVPQTIIIDQSGKIAAVTSPKNLTAAVLNDLLANKPLSLPVVKNSPPPDSEWDKNNFGDGIEPIFQTVIKPANTARGRMMVKNNRVVADGISLMAATVQAYQTSIFKIFFNFPEPQANYRISVIVPEGREDLLHTAFQQALETTFGMKVRREFREMDAYVMKGAFGKAANLTVSRAKESTTGFGEGVIRAQKQPISQLIADLENFLEKPVMDETGLKQEYDWELPYDWGSTDTLLNAVKERLGIELIKTKRPIEVLIFEKDLPKPVHK